MVRLRRFCFSPRIAEPSGDSGFADQSGREVWWAGEVGIASNRKLRLTGGVRAHQILLLVLLGISLAGGAVAAFASNSNPPQHDFADLFAHPPADARILKIIHNWPDKADAQDALIRRLVAQGFGGVVCNVSFDQYLESEVHWQTFTRAVHEARRAGMVLWLYDERGYPSGNAGGLVLRDHPEWESRGLLVADAICDDGLVSLELPPGRLVYAAALPITNDQIGLACQANLVGHVAGGKLLWTAPEGRWHVMAITEDRLYEGTHADGNLWQKMPYVNLLKPEPTKRFLDLTHEEYGRRLGGDLGKHFFATFTDEPSLMSCFLRPMPYRPLPWSDNLPDEFRRRRGYVLDFALLPALVANAGSQSEKVRHDFWLTVGELVSENFFGQIQERCRRLNIPSGGHLLMEEGLTAHVPLYGDFFRCARRLDAPSIDCLTSLPPEVPWYIARLLASAAELEGHTIVMSETSDHSQVWRPSGDARPKRIVTEAEIRGTCNRLFVGGVNRITSYYSFNGLDDVALQRINDWVGRCATMLTGGHQVADIAVLYPIESLWTKFTPARLWAKDSPQAANIEHVYRAALEDLFVAQRDFTLVDSRALADAGVKPGTLVHGDLQWRVVVLPATDTLPQAAWQNLVRFVRSGGVLIALGAMPRNSETEFPSPSVLSLARELFGEMHDAPMAVTNSAGGAGIFLPAGTEGLLPVALDGLLEHDVKVEERGSPLRTAHRRIAGYEVFFVINDNSKPWHGNVKFSAAGPCERWNFTTGTVTETNLGDRVNLKLGPYEAVGLRFPSARVPRRLPVNSGALPSLEHRTTPVVAPQSTAGQFVRADLAADAHHSKNSQPAWRASATLTKGDADTFMFVRFGQPQPLDLSSADWLVIDTWVPEKQRTRNEILIILKERDGGDFIANTGRSLGAPGYSRVYVPMNRLQLAGWSKDADATLDLKNVVEIRVGWGGYLGKEGERVEFSVALPQTGTMVGCQ